jgi:hypothetical protein
MGEDIKLKEENEGLKEEDTVTNDLQDNLQIEHYEGKYLTKQEILLFELYRSLQAVRKIKESTNPVSLFSYCRMDQLLVRF